MALCAVKIQSELADGCVLAPERYDPRRDALCTLGDEDSTPLAAVAVCVRQVIDRKTAGEGKWMVLDTSDAQEGIVVCRKNPIKGFEIGSSRVSRETDGNHLRLRPYLRQVGYVDEGIWCRNQGIPAACSTEFFVLRSTGNQSIAFLVPFLLSEPVQKVLAVSQEGGHHPPFREDTLMSLPIPKMLLRNREETSLVVENAVRMYRELEKGIARTVAEMGRSLEGLEH